MTVRKRSLAAVLLVLAFAASAWSAARVRQRIKPFELPHRVKGHLEWIVRGEVAHVLEGGDMMLEKPNVHIAATESEPGRDITAKKAMVTDKKDTMNFEGDVTVVSTDGASLAADRLTWKVKAQMANTDSHVVIKRGRMDLSGDGLDAQVKRDMFKIHSNVKLIVRRKNVIMRILPGQAAL